MRFEVPQFIEVEDRIIGPLTWKQFVYLAGGGGVALMLFFTLPFILFVAFGFPVVVLAGFLAFHRVHDRPFSDFLESGLRFATGGKLYLWRKRQPDVVTESKERAIIAEAPPVGDVPLPSPTENNITSLSRKLELEALDNTKQ